MQSPLKPLDDIIKNKILDIFFNFAKKKLKKEKIKQILKDSVINTSNLINESEISDKLISFFNDAEISNVIKNIKINNGFDLFNLIKIELEHNIEYLFDDIETKNKFIEILMKELIYEIKEEIPEIYRDYAVEEILNKIISIENAIAIANKELSIIKKEINKPVRIETIFDFNYYLKNDYKYKYDIDLFESEDENFKNTIIEKLNNKESVHIKGQNKKITLYAVLCIIKETGRPCYVIESIDDWHRVKNYGFDNNSIFIHNFISTDTIEPIPDYSNVFIYSNNEQRIINNAVSYEKESIDFVVNKLVKYTNDYEVAYKLVTKTHGFYSNILMQTLKDSKPNPLYDVDNNDFNIVLTGLLFGKWRETKKEKEALEFVSNNKYSDIIKVIKKYTKGENPLFIFAKWNGNEFYVTSPEDAILELFNNVNDELWNRYLDKLKEIINCTYDYSQIVKLNNDYSDEVIEGIYNNLLIINNFLVDDEYDSYKKDIINAINNKIDNLDKIENLICSANYLKYIAEISPVQFLNNIKEQLLKGKAVCSFINEKNGTSIFNTEYSYSLVWSIELLLFCNEYLEDALEVLFLINEKLNEDNNPASTLLTDIFSSWINCTPIVGNKKVELLRKHINKYSKAYKVLLTVLPGEKTSIVDSFVKPKYLPIESFNKMVLTKDIFNTYKAYEELFIEVISNNYECLINSIDKIFNFSNEGINNSLIIISKSINNYNDTEKLNIELKIRKEIYDNRYHNDASWATSGDNIILLEKIINSINYGVSEYKYAHLFYDNIGYILLNPISYNDNNFYNDYHKNEEEARRIILSKIEEFNSKGLNFKILIGILPNTSNIGLYVNRFTGNDYSIDDIKMLSEYNSENNLINYGYYLINNKDYHKKYIKDLIDLKIDNDIIASIAKQEIIIRDIVNYFDEIFPLELKNVFWKKDFLNIDYQNKNVVESVLNNTENYGNAYSYLQILYNARKNYNNEELYNKIVKIVELKLDNNIDYNMFVYYLEKMMTSFNKWVEDENYIQKLADIELMYLYNYDKLIFVPKIISINPSIYAEIISALYMDDNGNINNNDKNYVKYCFMIYNELHFCPGYIDGKFNNAIFDNWIEEYKKLLKENNRLGMYGDSIGRLLPYSVGSSITIDLNNHLIEFIEKENNKELNTAFISTVINKRGVYTNTKGEEEKNISLIYKNYANLLRNNKNCYEIYESLYKSFNEEAKNEKQRSKYEN